MGCKLLLPKDYNDCKIDEQEYGERVGSFLWAFKAAYEEGEVWHEHFGKCYIQDETLVMDKIGHIAPIDVPVSITTLSGWSKNPKTDKEILIDEIKMEFNGITTTMSKLELDIINLLDRYEIKKK